MRWTFYLFIYAYHVCDTCDVNFTLLDYWWHSTRQISNSIPCDHQTHGFLFTGHLCDFGDCKASGVKSSSKSFSGNNIPSKTQNARSAAHATLRLKAFVFDLQMAESGWHHHTNGFYADTWKHGIDSSFQSTECQRLDLRVFANVPLARVKTMYCFRIDFDTLQYSLLQRCESFAISPCGCGESIDRNYFSYVAVPGVQCVQFVRHRIKQHRQSLDVLIFDCTCARLLMECHRKCFVRKPATPAVSSAYVTKGALR